MVPLEKAVALKADGDEALVLLANCQLDRGSMQKALGGGATWRSRPTRRTPTPTWSSAPCSSRSSTTPRRKTAYEKYLKLSPKGQFAGEIRSILASLQIAMLVLGIESSCDETAAALVEDGARVVADVVSSQVAVHASTAAWCPRSRRARTSSNLVPVLEEALAQAGATLDDVDGIAVTRGPGLVGALLVGVQAAKAIAWARGLPLVGVNHLEGHLSAVFLDAASGAAAGLSAPGAAGLGRALASW